MITSVFAHDVMGLSATHDELAEALRRSGYTASLDELLPALRLAGLREPATNEFRPPIRKIEVVKLPVAEPVFSYFKGGISSREPYKDITAGQFWKLIRGPYLADKTRLLRSQPAGSEARDRIKRSLDYATPAGSFRPTRANENLASSSGLMVLDFDHLSDPDASRQKILADEQLGSAVVLAFISPSGDGLKVWVEIDPNVSHLENFSIVADYMSSKYGPELTPDKSGKDVARACFACHDATAWLAPRCAA
ncbi:BT4734/BF3469 family protein [uncultured Hymenobacter sp.]|uniref:BT4734/BF3469 family protein n=1 Tax=uncultured Hymenobacter sp. TaxID=170016 RepID=UPI0035CC315C